MIEIVAVVVVAAVAALHVASVNGREPLLVAPLVVFPESSNKSSS